MSEKNSIFDVIVIGDGPAGITSSIYIKRAGFNVLIISNGKSALKRTDKIENYYGFENAISGKTLYNSGINQAKNLNIEVLKKEVIGIKYEDNGFETLIANQGIDEKYVSKFIIIATGVNRNTPQIKGIKEFEGKGVSYCAICDAAFYRDKEVAVLGNGEYALGEIEELIPVAKSVTMLTNGEELPKTRLQISINNSKIEEFRGDTRIKEVTFKDGSSNPIDGLFIAQGTASSIDFAKKIGAKVDNNSIVVNTNMETTVPNVFACGDCTGGILQISKASYEGMKAGLEIIKKLRGGK